MPDEYAQPSSTEGDLSINLAKRAGSAFSVVLTILALMIVVPGSTQAAELNDPILARVADVLAGYT